MGQWRDFPLPDGSYSDDTRPWSQQDVYNYLPTFAEAAGTRSRVLHKPAPGLDTFANVGSGPHRGGHDVEGKAFVVSGTTLYQVAVDGTATSKGTIPGTGFVSMTHNQIDSGNELVIGTGSNSYVYNTVTGALAATGVALQSVDFLNQRILGVDQQRRFWRYSDLADATSYNDLDVESAESSPDRIIGGCVSQGEWLVFGERTIEVWTNSVTDSTSFQRSVVVERGCLNANTIRRLDNTVFFVDNNGIPCRLQGYQPVPIAPKAIVQQIAACDPTKLFAFTWEDKGYVVYYITAQDGQTWGFDVSSSKWHRRESFGLTRWRLNTLFKWNGDWYAGDYSNGKMYRLTWGYVYEGCELMPRGVRTGVTHNSGNRISIHGFRLLANTGSDPSTIQEGAVAPSITGSLPDAYVGDDFSYQYTLTRAYPGQEVTLTLDGALPTGLSIDANGLVTGTVTAAGTFPFTITPSAECADGVAFADSAVITSLVLGAQLSGWRYKQIGAADATDYSPSAYDDSAWSTGTAPFGSWEDGSTTPVTAAQTYDSRFSTAFATAWTANTRLWLRRTLTLVRVPEAGVNLVSYIEDNAKVYVNGVLVADTPDDVPAGAGWTGLIAASYFTVGANVIAVRCDDEAPVPAVSLVYADFLLETP